MYHNNMYDPPQPDNGYHHVEIKVNEKGTGLSYCLNYGKDECWNMELSEGQMNGHIRGKDAVVLHFDVEKGTTYYDDGFKHTTLEIRKDEFVFYGPGRETLVMKHVLYDHGLPLILVGKNITRN